MNNIFQMREEIEIKNNFLIKRFYLQIKLFDMNGKGDSNSQNLLGKSYDHSEREGALTEKTNL